TRGDVGPGVAVPTFRWHPAVLAQASATLAAMYPGRHWLGIGSGEAINEHAVAGYWPEAPERINRMFEAIEIITKLFGNSAAGKDPDGIRRVIQLHTAWAPSEDEAVQEVLRHWPNGAMRFPKADLRSPFEVAQMARLLRAEDARAAMVISADPADHLREIQRYV